MKKISTYSLLAFAAAVLSFSCVKPAVEAPVQEEPVGETVTVSCTFAQPDTKVAINDANGKSTWEVGDEILIHGKKTSENVTVTLAAGNISADGKVATFTVTLPATPYGPNDEDAADTKNGFYAAYPASAYIEYSSERGYNYNTFNNTNLPLMSAYYETDNARFVFANLCGVISFKVSGGDAYDEYMLMGKAGENVGYGRYVAQTRYGKTQYYLKETGSPLKTVRGAVVADGTTVNRIFIPNGVNFTNGFYIYLLKDGTIVKQLEYASAVNVPRNSYRPLPDITSYLTAFSAPVHSPAAWTSGATDISLELGGTANCYYKKAADIAANAAYKFPAKKGNSLTAVSGIALIDVVWETFNNATSVKVGDVISKVDFDSDWIYFQMPGTVKAGNALIAAMDIYGTILWSWHIWIPTDAVSYAACADFSDNQMMNMNLGSLVVAPSSGEATAECLGLLYQWGRKDPFVSAREFDEYPSKSKVAGTSWSSSNGKITMDEAIKNPTKYAYVYEADPSDWLTVTDEDLWDNAGEKTINDPCPPTYKVPAYDGGKSIWAKNDANWTFDGTNHVSKHTASGVVFPMAGYIECYAGGLYGTDRATVVWSSTHYADNVTDAMGIMIRTNKTPKFYKDHFGKANAASVRCVKE